MADSRRDQDRKKSAAPTSPRTTAPGDPEIAEGMRNPAGEPGMGRQTAEGIAAPGQREAVQGRDKVVGGFTSTGTTGSEGGRATYGTETEDEEDSV